MEVPNIIIDEPRTCAQVGGVVHGRGRPRAASAPRRAAVDSPWLAAADRHSRDPLLGSRYYLHGTSGGRLCGGRAAGGSGAGAFGDVIEHAADARRALYSGLMCVHVCVLTGL